MIYAFFILNLNREAILLMNRVSWHVRFEFFLKPIVQRIMPILGWTESETRLGAFCDRGNQVLIR